MKNAKIQAVCDLNESIALKTAKDHKIPRAYSDITQMIANEDLDIVDICVPPQIHTPIAIEAMSHGCNVLMEKPMALTVSDCDKMINVAKKNNVKICVIHNKNFHPPFIKAKKMIEAGEIGKFIGMNIFLSTPHDHMIDLKNHWYHQLPGGIIGETGPHVAYMSSEFIKDIDQVEISAKNYLNHSWAPHDEFKIDLQGKNGFSSIILSYTTDYWAAEAKIIGTESCLNLDLHSMILTKYNSHSLSQTSLAKTSLSTLSQTSKNIAANVFNSLTKRQKIGTELIIEQFAESIKNNSNPPVTGEDGRESVRVMEMIVDKYHEKYQL